MNEPRVDLIRIAGGEAQVEAIARNLQRPMSAEVDCIWPQPMVAAGVSGSAIYAKLEVSIED